MVNKINVTIRIDKSKVEKLKDIARRKSLKDRIDITYNDLIVSAALKEYFSETTNK